MQNTLTLLPTPLDEALTTIIEINGQTATVSYDPKIGMMRGAFLELTGGADFYAADADKLAAEAEISLRVYLEACAERGIEPFRTVV